MTEPRDRYFGNTVSERVAMYPEELPVDAVGLWQIIPFGRDSFGFEGDELTDFARRCITALLERGARPVRGGGNTAYDWILQPQYGSTTEEIVEAVIAEWLASGGGDPDPGDLWFALPEFYEMRKDGR